MFCTMQRYNWMSLWLCHSRTQQSVQTVKCIMSQFSTIVHWGKVLRAMTVKCNTEAKFSAETGQCLTKAISFEEPTCHYWQNLHGTVEAQLQKDCGALPDHCFWVSLLWSSAMPQCTWYAESYSRIDVMLLLSCGPCIKACLPWPIACILCAL